MKWICHHPRLRCYGFLIPVLLVIAASSYARASELTDLSLEELFNVEVVSVSKKPERGSDVAAALAVISGDDIRHSGATSIPEALRAAPGVNVARINSSQWAVSMRGFSNRFSNKLLVMMDGRSIYTPLFAGVFWDVQNTFMDDVDRIEVVRGPGGTLWGANAVNGVINVISKSAKDTQGGLAYAGGGTEERVNAGVRYGGKLGDDVHYRVYGRYFERDAGFNGSTADFDSWWIAQGGFRSDWTASASDTLTLQGDAYGGETAPFSNTATGSRDTVNGANLLSRWRHTFSTTSEAAVQVYYDGTLREDDYFTERRHTFDFDLQHRFQPLSRNEVVWGVGARVSSDRFEGSPAVNLDRDRRQVTLVSGFLQDEIAIVEDVLRFSIGTKLEHNDFTGFEFQPSARLAWSIASDETLWGAVSRAVRVPSRVENDLVIESPGTGTTPTTRFLGSKDTLAEELLAYEIGYRFKPTTWVFFDAAAFLNRYDDLITLSARTPVFEPQPPPGRVVVPAVIDNAMSGETYGGELASTFAPTEHTQVRASYAYLKVKIDPPAGSIDAQAAAGSSPQNQIGVSSRFDLPGWFESDAMFRYVDSLPQQHVRSYVDLDLRLARRFWNQLDVSIVGHNLLQAHHREFSGGTEVQRGVYGRMALLF